MILVTPQRVGEAYGMLPEEVDLTRRKSSVICLGKQIGHEWVVLQKLCQLFVL